MPLHLSTSRCTLHTADPPLPTEPWGTPQHGLVLLKVALVAVCQGLLEAALLGAGWPRGGLAQGWWLLQVITPFRKLILCAENRKEMEDWISALKSVQKWEIHEVTWAGGCVGAHLKVGTPQEPGVPLAAKQELLPLAQPCREDGNWEWVWGDSGTRREGVPAGGPRGLMGQGCAFQQATQFNMEHFSGMHNWYACSHARPTFCNVCREALPGVTSHGLSCEGQYQGPAGGWAGVGTGVGDPLRGWPGAGEVWGDAHWLPSPAVEGLGTRAAHPVGTVPAPHPLHTMQSASSRHTSAVLSEPPTTASGQPWPPSALKSSRMRMG